MYSHLPIQLFLVAALLHALSGMPGLLPFRRATAGRVAGVVLSCVASLLGLVGVALVFLWGTAKAVLPLQMLGEPVPIEVDALSAFFMVPVLVVGALGSVYGLGYWSAAEHRDTGRPLSLFWGLAVSGMVVLLAARHAALFLLGWEIMALAAFFLISTEHRDPEVRQAGWIYFVATHIATLSLFALFAFFHRVTGSYELRAIAVSEVGLGPLTVAFFLTLLGFGLKAGLMPLHFWLPAAHANAPSHVSALLSGVVLKIGIYGLVRFIGFLPVPPVAWGGLVLVIGCISGVLGVLFALGQHDLKRLLAYHSIENIGIILMGFGLALMGRSLEQPTWVIFGMAGCLLHTWNHALFKPLLFLGAGATIHAVGTPQIDRMGGLAKSMPWTAVFFLIGAVAICGLPPLNGFVSEWLVYLGLFHAAIEPGSAVGIPVLAVPALALIGALALACFVKVYGAVFLGQARQPLEGDVHEAPLSMRLPMGLLAACCVAIGLLPWLLIPLLEQAILAWDTEGLLHTSNLFGPQQPLKAIALAGLALVGVCLLVLFLLSRKIHWRDAPHPSTWSCGYALPTERMQYTASSFAQMLVGLFRRVLAPRIHAPLIQKVIAEPSHFESHLDEPVLDRALLPSARFIRRLFLRARPLQRGLTHQYLIYVILAVIVLMICKLPLLEMLKQLFSR